jgi:hypothetical protein
MTKKYPSVSTIEATYTVVPAPSVTDQPSMDLWFWRVIEDGNRGRHLFGNLPGTERCRMTTEIIDVDLAQRRWVTSSGRVYRTHDVPGEEIESDLLSFLAWHHKLPGDPTDVTAEFWRAMQAALQ